MRKIAITLAIATAVVFTGSLTLKPEAAAFEGAATIRDAAATIRPVKPAACMLFRVDRCALGFHPVCGPRRCWCAPC
jgi:hypothetical protein